MPQFWRQKGRSGALGRSLARQTTAIRERAMMVCACILAAMQALDDRRSKSARGEKRVDHRALVSDDDELEITDTVDVAVQTITLLCRADTGRRAGEDQIARRQLEQAREE